jgi:hypothetical protein
MPKRKPVCHICKEKFVFEEGFSAFGKSLCSKGCFAVLAARIQRQPKGLWEHLAEPEQHITTCLLCMQGANPLCPTCSWPTKPTEQAMADGKQLWDHLKES